LARDPHQQALMNAAPALGIAVEDLAGAWAQDAVRYSRGDRSEVVLRGRVFPHLSSVAEALCDDKHACKAALRSVGVPVPHGVRFVDPTAAASLLTAGTWVAKPLDGTHGEGVCMGIRSPEDLRDAFDPAWPVWLLEEQIDGEDLRLQAVDGVLVAACRREPASVQGDGTSTVRELIAARRVAVQAANAANDLVVDGEVQAHLADQALSLDDVPAAHRSIPLRSTSNMATGGRAVDFTDALHPDWVALVRTVGEALGISVFAVDAVTVDPSRPPSEFGAVIEVNARPEWLHHTFSDRRQHDLPRLLFDQLFGV
jgi:D-alanine-D-alanine ligase-like ATP-grasp enzyme